MFEIVPFSVFEELNSTHKNGRLRLSNGGLNKNQNMYYLYSQLSANRWSVPFMI